LREETTTDHRADVGKRLYISRANQKTRRVRNEKEIRPVLDDYGFDIVYPEMWPLSKQIATFAEAEMILGPHGAGLVNIIYGDDTTLIELFGKRTNPCFFAIARGMDRRYAMMQCTPVGSDLHVEPTQLNELLSSLL
jgi:capsular polysaccharide biosynthesis protein